MPDKDYLAGFRDTFVGPSEYVDRISELILLDICKLNVEYGVSPLTIFDEIKNLERGERPTGVKLATQFKYLPLKGLWHKHFFSAYSLAWNIGNAGLDKLLGRLAKSPMGVGEIANDLHEIFKTRDARKKVTGKWRIVYLQHEEKNYYLCCDAHGVPDQFTYDRIMEHCVRDFPDLQDWLKDQQNS